MILKQIYLKITSDRVIEFRDDKEKWKEESTYQSFLIHKTSSLIYFLERTVLKPLKFKTDDIHNIQIYLEYENPSDEVDLRHEKTALTEILFEQKKFDSCKTKEEYNEFFIEALTNGLKKTNNTVKIPLTELISGMEEFRKIGYENRWTFKTRQSKELGVKCRLNCNLTLENFHLNLQIEKKGKKIIFDKEILKTEPSSFAYHNSFKDIIFDGNYIKVVDDTYGQGIESYIEERNKLFDDCEPSPVDGVLFKINIDNL